MIASRFIHDPLSPVGTRSIASRFIQKHHFFTNSALALYLFKALGDELKREALLVIDGSMDKSDKWGRDQSGPYIYHCAFSAYIFLVMPILSSQTCMQAHSFQAATVVLFFVQIVELQTCDASDPLFDEEERGTSMTRRDVTNLRCKRSLFRRKVKERCQQLIEGCKLAMQAIPFSTEQLLFSFLWLSLSYKLAMQAIPFSTWNLLCNCKESVSYKLAMQAIPFSTIVDIAIYSYAMAVTNLRCKRSLFRPRLAFKHAVISQGLQTCDASDPFFDLVGWHSHDTPFNWLQTCDASDPFFD